MIEKGDFLVGASISVAVYLGYLLIDRNSWLRRQLFNVTRGPWVKLGKIT